MASATLTAWRGGAWCRKGGARGSLLVSLGKPTLTNGTWSATEAQGQACGGEDTRPGQSYRNGQVGDWLKACTSQRTEVSRGWHLSRQPGQPEAGTDVLGQGTAQYLPLSRGLLRVYRGGRPSMLEIRWYMALERWSPWYRLPRMMLEK